MNFPLGLTSVLTGASVYQLRRWSTTNILIPEIHTKSPMLYSFRDLVAVRTVVRLRANTSLQKIRKAINKLRELDLTEHLSEYRFATDEKTIVVWDEDHFLDLLNHPGQYHLFTLQDIYQPFVTRGGVEVVDFLRPKPNLTVDSKRLGGWPTVAGTRVQYDVVADRLADGAVAVEDITRHYPGVSVPGTRDAVAFDREVRAAAA